MRYCVCLCVVYVFASEIFFKRIMNKNGFNVWNGVSFERNTIKCSQKWCKRNIHIYVYLFMYVYCVLCIVVHTAVCSMQYAQHIYVIYIYKFTHHYNHYTLIIFYFIENQNKNKNNENDNLFSGCCLFDGFCCMCKCVNVVVSVLSISKIQQNVRLFDEEKSKVRNPWNIFNRIIRISFLFYSNASIKFASHDFKNIPLIRAVFFFYTICIPT